MSIFTVENGVNKELSNLLTRVGGVTKSNLQWYGKVDETNKLLSEAFDDSKIAGLIIKPGYYYLSLYGSDGKQSSNTSVTKDVALSYLNFSVSGKTIDISSKAGRSRVYMYLYVWIQTSDGQLNRIAQPRLDEFVRDKMTWDYSYYYEKQVIGSGTTFNEFTFRSGTTYTSSVDNYNGLQNTWFNGHLSPLFSQSSGYGDLRLGAGSNADLVNRTVYRLDDPKWNGRSIPLTIEL